MIILCAKCNFLKVYSNLVCNGTLKKSSDWPLIINSSEYFMYYCRYINYESTIFLKVHLTRRFNYSPQTFSVKIREKKPQGYGFSVFFFYFSHSLCNRRNYHCYFCTRLYVIQRLRRGQQIKYTDFFLFIKRMSCIKNKK